MSTANKAWYWLAAGVLALGLNGYYQDGGLPALHRITERTTVAVSEVQAQVHQVATLAELALADQAQSACPRTEPSVVAVSPVAMPAEAEARLARFQEHMATLENTRVQVQMARLQQVIAGREMQRAQVEIENGRVAVLTSNGQVRIAVPSMPRVQVGIPQAPVIEVMPN